MSQFRQLRMFPSDKSLNLDFKEGEVCVDFIEYAALEAAQKEIQRLKYENEVYVSLTEPRIEQLAAALKVAEGALKRLSRSGDGIHSDKKASFYDCLPTLQIEFSERKELAKETLSEIQKIKKGKM